MATQISPLLLDSNVLLYAVNPLLQDHQRTLAVLEKLWASGAELVVSQQILREFLVVATGNCASA